MSKSKRSSKSGGHTRHLNRGQRWAVLVVCVVTAVISGLWSISEFWPGPSLEAEGQVVGQGCADRASDTQTTTLENCHIIYSIVDFEDAHGQQHEINRPENNLSGTFIVHYRFITLPGNITLGVSVDGQDPRWVRGAVGVVLCLGSLILAGLTIRELRAGQAKDNAKSA